MKRWGCSSSSASAGAATHTNEPRGHTMKTTHRSLAANVPRKHPVSIAVSMALLAAAAASAVAAEGTAAPAENAGAQGPTKSATDSGGTDQGPAPKTQLETIVITGVRE